MVRSEIEASKALRGTSTITIESKTLSCGRSGDGNCEEVSEESRTLSHGRSGVSEETRPLSHGRYSKALDKRESSKYIVYGLCHC